MTVTTLPVGDSVLFVVGSSVVTTVVGIDVLLTVNSAVGMGVVTIVRRSGSDWFWYSLLGTSRECYKSNHKNK